MNNVISSSATRQEGSTGAHATGRPLIESATAAWGTMNEVSSFVNILLSGLERMQHENFGSRNATGQITVVIRIQCANRDTDSKSATPSFCDGLSRMTNACLTSLGHALPPRRRIKLWCAHQVKRWTAEFEIVESADTDVSLCEDDWEQVLLASQAPGLLLTEAAAIASREWASM